MRKYAAGSARVRQKRLFGEVVVEEDEAATSMQFYRPGGGVSVSRGREDGQQRGSENRPDHQGNQTAVAQRPN